MNIDYRKINCCLCGYTTAYPEPRIIRYQNGTGATGPTGSTGATGATGPTGATEQVP